VTHLYREIVTFFDAYAADIAGWTLDHLILTFLAMFIACGLAIPLGVALARCPWQWLSNAVLRLVSLVQPIPSLALVALVGVVFIALGLSTLGLPAALIALVAYALLPILRNTYTGLRQVEPSVIEVARGMGMTSRQVLFRVQLPLALPVIMAGVRISTVWTVGVATLVSRIGATSLGTPIFRGLATYNIPLILAGTIPAVALALVFDWLLGAFESWLTPAGMKAEDNRKG
jgi:osmoprotectant transport system permease protein